MSFSARNRSRYLQQLQNEQFDLLVIGGGITGAGIALDATARVVKSMFNRKDDFCFRNKFTFNSNSWRFALFKTIRIWHRA